VLHLDMETKASPSKPDLAVPPAPPPSPAEESTALNGLSFKIPEAGTSVNSDFNSWKAKLSRFH
uniref:Uncharacterized protein n=1 Tax=Chinchilla lanigera TaxID=34839 RepID=A0A8C2VU91_CHILA